MNKSILIAASALAAAFAFAQDVEKPEFGAKGPPPKMQIQGFMPNAGMWIPKMFSHKKALAKIGVTDEAVVEKISTGLDALQSRGGDLEGKIRELSREQAKLFRSLIKDKDADQKPVMEIIDEIAKLRAEQGRLSVEAIVLLRDNLTPEQMKKAFDLVHERGGERNRMRMGQGRGEPPFAPPKEMRDGPRPPEGKGPRPPEGFRKNRPGKPGKHRMRPGEESPEEAPPPPAEAPETPED